MDAFVTVTQYAEATRQTISAGSALETAVQFALDAACDDIRSYTGQLIDPVDTDVIVVDGTGHRGLLLPELPINALNTVTIDKDLTTELVVTDAVIGFGGVLYRTGAQTVPDSWLWHHHRRRGSWPWGIRNITVDYDHGFVDIPNDLINVAIQVARATIGAGPPGLTGETIGGYSYTRDATIAGVMAFKAALDRYKVKRIPVP